MSQKCIVFNEIPEFTAILADPSDVPLSIDVFSWYFVASEPMC